MNGLCQTCGEVGDLAGDYRCTDCDREGVIEEVHKIDEQISATVARIKSYRLMLSVWEEIKASRIALL